MPVPVTEGGEAHGGRYKCYSPGKGVVATEKNGKNTGHTHGEKLRKELMKTKTNKPTIHLENRGHSKMGGKNSDYTENSQNNMTTVKFCTCINFLTEAVS